MFKLTTSQGNFSTDYIPIDDIPTNDIPNVATVSSVEPRQVSGGNTTTNAAYTCVNNINIQLQVSFAF
jgi:hypothetical protein